MCLHVRLLGNHESDSTLAAGLPPRSNYYMRLAHQSFPLDHFQWASTISRYIMGFIMMLLLVLNVGKYQAYFIPDGAPYSQRAGFINWIDT